MDASLRARLVEVLGAGGVADGDAVTPANAAQVADVCRLCTEAGTAITVISSPDATELAAVRGIVISLARMTNATIDSGAQMAHAEAGAMLSALRSAARHQKLAPVGVTSGGPEHVGSAIARGTIAARSLVGVDLVLADGTRIKAGGRTLKDVTGYDLGGLVLGSMGRLAIIVGASFRLVPDGASIPDMRAHGASAVSPSLAALQASLDPAGRLHPAA